jgi:hypothetical protein
VAVPHAPPGADALPAPEDGTDSAGRGIEPQHTRKRSIGVVDAACRVESDGLRSRHVYELRDRAVSSDVDDAIIPGVSNDECD